ncbi:hypothetical protein IF1G_08411 [Cordyceps javanica]|uniref:Uncharacterized protein n=1 Tax=Cordyceps javanica TaxID=43265 RepID=A0A545UUG5_9HYPO|nr:hypothetical protein IF1G_08411 [Cordyceps javanica]
MHVAAESAEALGRKVVRGRPTPISKHSATYQLGHLQGAASGEQTLFLLQQRACSLPISSGYTSRTASCSGRSKLELLVAS